MADTKQATPDFEKIALEMFQNCVLRGEDEEIWHDVAKGAAILKKHWLASRSGPDRTTPEEKLVIQPQLADVMKDLDYRGIHWDAELAEEGTGWEVAAEPEPQYFETLREALDFFVSLKEPQAGPDRGQQDAPEMWLEFIVKNMCSLCGQVGIIDTRGIKTPANFECGGLHYCICPNGRALKEQSADKLKWLQLQNPAAKAAREGQAPKGDVWIAVEKE